MSVTSGGGTGDIQAVHRVAEILRLFTLMSPRLTVAEAAARVGLNRTTLHRYFTSMVLDEILERAPDDATVYVPGRLMLQLGAVAQGQRRVLDLAPRHMDALSVDTGLTVVLSLWGASGPVVSLVSEAGTHPILITVRIGSTLGPDSAQTRLFVALSGDKERFERYLSRIGEDERAKLDRHLPRCRSRGLTRIRIPAVDGVVLAAAVFDEHDVAATVALVGTTSSLPKEATDMESALLRTVGAITEELGGGDTRRNTLTEP
ncbi:IclR family transcriptional regulator [Actinophytocola sp.]|uniref:IclR family transcriptional regulator n=1 Tax=Actinophytocola sp. TaxID=1872138 RepID=UPI002D59CA05|nr:helix-turn-helix domain-containing protein [Actinophytocola sp.]HYQ68180.1 helix-turn-helix domain-containing protein [Actinophytocola sp.]